VFKITITCTDDPGGVEGEHPLQPVDPPHGMQFLYSVLMIIVTCADAPSGGGGKHPMVCSTFFQCF